MSKYRGRISSDQADTISSKLKFISKLQSGQKIFVKDKSLYLRDDSYITSLSRYLSGEGREKSFKFINDTIQDSLAILNSYSNSRDMHDIDICTNMIIDLINISHGLENLKKTYKSDHAYVSKLETLMQNLQVEIKRLCANRQLDYTAIVTRAKNIHQEEIAAASTTPTPTSTPTPIPIPIPIPTSFTSQTSTPVSTPLEEKKMMANQIKRSPLATTNAHSDDESSEEPDREPKQNTITTTPSSDDEDSDEQQLEPEPESEEPRQSTPEPEQDQPVEPTPPEPKRPDTPRPNTPPPPPTKCADNNCKTCDLDVRFTGTERMLGEALAKISDIPQQQQTLIEQNKIEIMIDKNISLEHINANVNPNINTKSTGPVSRQIETEESNKLRRRKHKHQHQYDSYYVSNQEDIHLYRPDFQKGLMK